MAKTALMAKTSPKRVGQGPMVKFLDGHNNVGVLSDAEVVSWFQSAAEKDAILLAQASQHSVTVIAASTAYQHSHGFAKEELVGRGLNSILTLGAPHMYVSHGEQTDVDSFCMVCAEPNLHNVGEFSVEQPAANKDGSLYWGLSWFLFMKLHNRNFIVVGQKCKDWSGANLMNQPFDAVDMAACRSMVRRTRAHMLQAAGQEMPKADLTDATRPFAFFSRCLQSRCVLFNHGFSAARRQMVEMPKGCLVFSDRPIALSLSSDLRFKIKVEAVTAVWTDGPLLGFTRRPPSDTADTYPRIASHLGASVLIGEHGASARDDEAHFCGDGVASTHEVEQLRPQASEALPGLTQLEVGDELMCVYTGHGNIQLWLNGKIALDIDTKRPLDPHTEYFAVVDLRFSLGAISILSDAETTVLGA